MIRLWQRLTRATQQGPDADIRTLMRREFGLRVGQRRTYDEALTHSSMLDGDKTGLKSNERLEFLGDVVLDMTMANYLYRAFPDAQEGLAEQFSDKLAGSELSMALLQSYFMLYRDSAEQACHAADELGRRLKEATPPQQIMSELAMSNQP